MKQAPGNTSDPRALAPLQKPIQEALMFSKVPEVTIYFWIIKILATTVGETAADFLNYNLNLGLTNTTYVIAGILLIVLFFQFRARRYVPWIYWLTVVLISIVG